LTKNKFLLRFIIPLIINMKNIIKKSGYLYFPLLFLLLITVFSCFCGMLAGLLPLAAGAEPDPLDMLQEKDDFAVTVGKTNINGRYWTYHYHYAD